MISITIAIFGFICPLAAADDQPGISTRNEVRAPETPAGRQFAEWLELFNKADAERLGRFNEKNLAESIRIANPPAKRTEMELNVAKQTGGFVLDSINSLSDYELEAT